MKAGLPPLLDDQGRPSGFADEINKQDFIILNCKALASYIAEMRIKEVQASPAPTAPVSFPLKSKCAVQKDFESDWLRFWLNELQQPFTYSRKLWEWAYILQVLHMNGMINENKTGLGMGCGQEPLPCYLASKGCSIVASDQPPEGGSADTWAAGNQFANSLKALYYPTFMETQRFEELVSLQYIDMNKLPEDLYGRFDFCWSSCVVEHLGSIAQGLHFLKESVKLLKPGGVSIHTVECNYLNTPKTMDNYSSVLFKKDHFLSLESEIRAMGFEIEAMDFDFSIGDDIFDRYIDLNPYPFEKTAGLDIDVSTHYPPHVPHIKLWLGGVPSTSFGLIIKK